MGPPVIRHGRRRFLRGGLALAGLGLLSGCETVPWAPSRRRPRLGLLSFAALGSTPEYAALQEGLRGLGYVPGEMIQIEARSGSLETLAPELATLVASKPDVLIAVWNNVARAAKQATANIPIVMLASADPVRSGLIDSLARPSGNVTGVSPLVGDLAGKRLELLRATVPSLSRVGLMWNPDDPDQAADVSETQAAAQQLGLQLIPLPLGSSNFSVKMQAIRELAGAENVEALVVGFDLENLQFRILPVAAERRLPVIYPSRNAVTAGGLMAYGPSPRDMFRRAANYVDKIIRGAKPADLPVEQPTTFDFAINLKTAQTLGLTIPLSVLQQATEIIQ
jgi:putative tryptophan/tyrosine transport system substrate-binding protein